jgi:hypothetical protein
MKLIWLPVAALMAVPSFAAPSTPDVLALAPKEAQVAIALPPISESLDEYVAFLNKVAPQLNVEAELAEAVADLARDAKVEGAESFEDVATARGLDASKPSAAFLDFSKSLEPIRMAQKGDDGGEAAAGDAAAEEAPAEEEMPEPDAPAWVSVYGVSDKAKVEELLKEVVANIPELASATVEAVEKGGQSVQVYGDYGYFITDSHAAIGSKDLLLATADQWDVGRKVRYGSDDLPANEHEIVALIYSDRFFPLLEELLPALEMDDVARSVAKAQLDQFKTSMASSDGEDPLVVTLTLSDGRADLRTRLDTKTHPGFLQQAGPASALRYGKVLPKDTLAMLTIRLNEETKKQLQEQLLPAIQEAGGQGAAFAGPVIQIIGEEITLGIAAVENDFPAAFLMIALADPEAAKGLLNMLVPTMPAETHAEEEIKSIAAPIPVPLAMATPGDTLLVSNNTDGMKKIIDLVKSNGTTEFFSSLGDPLAGDTPRYLAMLLKSALITDVVVPLSALGGGLPEDIAPTVNQLTASVDEVRYVYELQENWATAQFTLYLK